VASPTLVSVEEYLKGGYKPACEYLDGVLRQKPMPTWDHGFTQSRVGQLINENFPDFAAASEITVRLSETRFLVPDVIAQRKTDLQRPYPTQPVHLVVEILSPEDRMSDVIAKCEQYHAWGVRYCWIIDPEEQTAWDYPRGRRPSQIHRGGRLQAEPVALALSDLFAAVA